jgi:hypothetical protein
MNRIRQLTPSPVTFGAIAVGSAVAAGLLDLHAPSVAYGICTVCVLLTFVGAPVTTPSKRKGDAWEREIVAALIRSGHLTAERRKAGSSDDRGDIQGIPGVCIEAKDCAQKRYGTWLGELAVEMANTPGVRTGALVIKQIGKPRAEDALVVMPWHVWLDLLNRAEIN